MKHLKKLNNFNHFKQYQYDINNYTTPIVCKTNEGLLYKKKDPYNCPYQRIEYLEGYNNSIINLSFDDITNDMLVNNKLEYVTNLQLTNLNGGAEGINGLYFFVGISRNNYYSGCGPSYGSSNTNADLNKHELKLSVENNVVNYYLDNDIIQTYSFSSGFNSPLNQFGLFDCISYNGDLTNQRKYYAKLTLGNKIIFECFPVRIENKGYMYETVTKQLYSSRNLDSQFILGPDII